MSLNASCASTLNVCTHVCERQLFETLCAVPVRRGFGAVVASCHKECSASSSSKDRNKAKYISIDKL